jgi:hypothetical protein
MGMPVGPWTGDSPKSFFHVSLILLQDAQSGFYHRAHWRHGYWPKVKSEYRVILSTMVYDLWSEGKWYLAYRLLYQRIQKFWHSGFLS